MKNSFEFKIKFIADGFIIQAKEWHIVPGSLKKNQALVQAFGTDGELYDAIAIFYKTKDKCKSIKVNINSGKWDFAFWEKK